MKQFYQAYQNEQKLSPLVREIGWSHNLIIMMWCKDQLEREFYIRMTRKFGWTKNVLIHQIENQSYEKTLLGQTNFDKALTPKLRDQAHRSGHLPHRQTPAQRTQGGTAGAGGDRQASGGWGMNNAAVKGKIIMPKKGSDKITQNTSPRVTPSISSINRAGRTILVVSVPESRPKDGL
jgi:hypothetical protein